MTNLEKSIFVTLVYYDLLNRPLTALEIYKYLPALIGEVSFFEFKRTLENSLVLKKYLRSRFGLYFLNQRQDLISQREKRLKLAQLKWKKLIKSVRQLTFVPFLRLIAATGSLTAYNTRSQSDFDLLIVIREGRLWLTRALVTALTALLGVRRHGPLTQNRICLNCYLTENQLEIKTEAKPRDYHSVQEYGRLTPILEIKPGLYQQFCQANQWLKGFLNFYPWPNEKNAKRIKPNRLANLIRRFLEWLLAGKIGEGLEKALGQWQTSRINRKPGFAPADQIFISSSCLMFHPQSKSYELMKLFHQRMEQLTASDNQ